MKVIDIDKIEGKRIDTPGMKRTVKDILSVRNMIARMGIYLPGQQSSAHSHAESEELAYCVKGKGTITAEGEAKSFESNFLIYIPQGVTHQYKNVGNEELILYGVFDH